MHTRMCGWVRGGLVAVLGGCNVANPAFVVVSTTTVGSSVGTETTGSPTSSGTTTACVLAECASTGSIATESTTGSVDWTTGNEESSLEPGETSGSSSTTGTGAADTSSSGPGGPFDAVIDADIATCALSPEAPQFYGGPEICQTFVKQQLDEAGVEGDDGMIVDPSFNNANGRPAWAYLRFDLEALQGAELTSATLNLEVKATFGSPAGGQVRRCGWFDLGLLVNEAPGPEGPTGVDIGPVQMDDGMKAIDIMGLIPDPVPNWLYLVIVPQSESGVIYKDGASAPRPSLAVSYMQ